MNDKLRLFNRAKNFQFVYRFSAILFIAMALFGATAQAQKTPQGVEADMKFERGSFLRDYTYKKLDRMYLEHSPTGAYSKVNIEWEKNKQGKWYIEQQRNGAYAVVAGIATDNKAALERGILILKWAFAQQQPDGSWDCPDNHHSTSLFMTAAARAVLHLENSGYAKKYRSEIELMKNGLHKAAEWMILPENERRRELGKTPRVHRFYVLAGAIGQTGTLTNDKELLKKAAEYAREGLARQSPAGYNPENGGWDSSYNAAGLTFAAYYYLNAADDSIRPELFEMYRKAVAWEKSRISDQGLVSTEGNTRVGAATTEITRNGVPKTKVNVDEVTRSLAFWTFFSGDKSYEKLAEKVFVNPQTGSTSSEKKAAEAKPINK